MLISFCIPCMNRTYDLKKTMPYLTAAAKASPPVEVVILDYNSVDDLEDYIKSVKQENPDFILTYRKYSGRDTYHMAHARNLSVLAASGEYIVIFSTDLFPYKDFIPTVRRLIAETGAKWLYTGILYLGVIVCKKAEFVAAGGYDERFELYGPEDKDLNERLARRGVKSARYPEELIGIFRTTDTEKTKNYRLKMSKREMSGLMRQYYFQNNQDLIKVANQGLEWGSWNKQWD
ncbi:MAG TPA: glycosyltransferase [Candidatus Saccharimonadales bacterium]